MKLANTSDLCKDIEKYLRPSAELEGQWAALAKDWYDLLKSSETKFGFRANPSTLRKLHIDGFDAQEVWKQVDLQNEVFFAKCNPSDLSRGSNISYLVAEACEAFNDYKEAPGGDAFTASDSDTDSTAHSNDGGEEHPEDVSENENGRESDVSQGDDKGKEEEEEDGHEEVIDEEEEGDEAGSKEESEECWLKSGSLRFKNDPSSSEDEPDTFGELALNEPDEDDDSEGSVAPDESEFGPEKVFDSTVVDTRFFRLRESEWIADSDLIGDKYDLDSEDVDLIQNVDDEDEEGGNIMYSDFFDPPGEVIANAPRVNRGLDSPGVGVSVAGPSDASVDQGSDLPKGVMDFDPPSPVSRHRRSIHDNHVPPRGHRGSDFQTMKLKADDGDREREKSMKDKKVHFEDDAGESGNEDGEEVDADNTANTYEGSDADIEPGEAYGTAGRSVPKEELSTFERELDENNALISLMEEENVREKEWFLKGEVRAENRPKDSALEEHLDISVGTRPKPVITDETTGIIERIIVNRIKANAFDDVERVVKPFMNPMDYKKKLILEQDKSKKSLAELYEQEYLEKESKKKELGSSVSVQLTAKTEEQVQEEHKAIKALMGEVFPMLDALSNFHYNPRRKDTEVKVVSNLPAISVEEVVPITASDATLLAPAEILDDKRGDLLGDSEKMPTDRKREKRKKKHLMAMKAKYREQKLKEQLKKNPSGDLLKTESSIKVVQKAIKKGDIKVLDLDHKKSVKSSTDFFTQLQAKTEPVGSKRKWKNEFKEVKGNKKKRKEMSATKLLL